MSQTDIDSKIVINKIDNAYIATLQAQCSVKILRNFQDRLLKRIEKEQNGTESARQ